MCIEILIYEIGMYRQSIENVHAPGITSRAGEQYFAPITSKQHNRRRTGSLVLYKKFALPIHDLLSYSKKMDEVMVAMAVRGKMMGKKVMRLWHFRGEFAFLSNVFYKRKLISEKVSGVNFFFPFLPLPPFPSSLFFCTYSFFPSFPFWFLFLSFVIFPFFF